PFIGVPCHRRAADCCGENSTSKEEWNKELGTRHREQHNQRLLFTPSGGDRGWDSAGSALVLMADRSLTAAIEGGRPAPERNLVVIHVDAEVLKNPATASGRCEIDGGPDVSAETSRRLSCDCCVPHPWFGRALPAGRAQTRIRRLALVLG
ncbi:MAG: hypothetical protein V2A73_06005, partial [Pseudomonadota bacterium]